MALTPVQSAGLLACYAAATSAGHPHPGIAAAEAALETSTAAGGWFTSPLYVKSCNPAGLKPPSWWAGTVVDVPTDEFVPAGTVRPQGWNNPRNARPMVRAGVNGTMWTIDAEFCHFGSLEEAYRVIVQVLERSYQSALAQTTPEAFEQVESERWSTGPSRGEVVLQIYHAHLDLLGPQTAATG